MSGSTKERRAVLVTGLAASLLVLVFLYLRPQYIPGRGWLWGRKLLPQGLNAQRAYLSSERVQIGELLCVLEAYTGLKVVSQRGVARKFVSLGDVHPGAQGRRPQGRDVDAEAVRAIIEAEGYPVELHESADGTAVIQVGSGPWEEPSRRRAIRTAPPRAPQPRAASARSGLSRVAPPGPAPFRRGSSEPNSVIPAFPRDVTPQLAEQPSEPSRGSPLPGSPPLPGSSPPPPLGPPATAPRTSPDKIRPLPTEAGSKLWDDGDRAGDRSVVIPESQAR